MLLREQNENKGEVTLGLLGGTKEYGFQSPTRGRYWGFVNRQVTDIDTN